MKLTMLGTGNAQAVECYNTCFIMENEGELLLVDGGGGNGIFGQLKAAKYDWKDIHHIFVTHKHLDHIMGILWMIRFITNGMGQGKYTGEAWIYAHDEVIQILRDMSKRLLQEKQYRMIDERLHLVILEDGMEFDVLGCKAVTFDIHSTKAKQYGFSLQYGKKRITCCGDEPYHESEKQYAEGCDWLLHEAFCLHSDAGRFKPYEKHHSTVKDACELAEQLGVKNLILYHTEDSDKGTRKQRYEAEGKKFYSGNLWIPDDLESLEIS